MPSIFGEIHVNSKGKRDVINLNPDIEKFLQSQDISEGLLTVFVPGSTAAITTVEFEPGLKQDIDEHLNRLFPYGHHYHHHDTWHDDNGSSHLQAAMLGPSLSVPVSEGVCTLGTWQQIVLVDCDTRARDRRIVLQLLY